MKYVEVWGLLVQVVDFEGNRAATAEEIEKSKVVPKYGYLAMVA